MDAGPTSRPAGADEFAAQVAAQAAPLHRFALSITRDPVAAEDLVQETIARALAARDRYRADASVATWMHRILHNAAVDRARRGAREVLVAEVVEADWRDDAYTVDAEVVAERADVRAEVEDALLRVPFHSRAVLLLHDVDGWTVERIAEALGISLPAAKQRLRRGRMMMVTAMARGHERRAAQDGVPLRCWDARQWVSHYLDGELDPGRKAMVQRHIASCPTCPPLVAALTGTHRALGGLRDPDSVISPQLAARLAREGTPPAPDERP